MKPLIILQFDPSTDRENVELLKAYLDEEVNNGGVLSHYEFMVIQGDMKISVHYPNKPISYYFNKLKAWLILKIWKRKKFSNTSVIL